MTFSNVSSLESYQTTVIIYSRHSQVGEILTCLLYKLVNKFVFSLEGGLKYYTNTTLQHQYSHKTEVVTVTVIKKKKVGHTERLISLEGLGKYLCQMITINMM